MSTNLIIFGMIPAIRNRSSINQNLKSMIFGLKMTMMMMMKMILQLSHKYFNRERLFILKKYNRHCVRYRDYLYDEIEMEIPFLFFFSFRFLEQINIIFVSRIRSQWSKTTSMIWCHSKVTNCTRKNRLFYRLYFW